MNTFLELFTNYVLPTAGTALSGFAIAWTPFLVKQINQFLKNKLNIQDDIIQVQQQEWLEKQAIAAIQYVEELSRRKVNDLLSTENPLTPQEKLGMTQDILAKNTGLNLDTVNKLIHSVLFQQREGEKQ